MRALKMVLLALLGSLLFGLTIGTWLRLRLERQPVYIGRSPALGPAFASYPGHIGNTGPSVLHARHHEEEIREPVQVAERHRVDALQTL